MPHTVRNHLRLATEEYDQAIRRFIPGYDTMLAVAADAAVAVEPAAVVDLGAGTGALAEAILERRARVTVDLIDVDGEMLDQARRRLARFGDRARFTLRSYDGPLPSADAFATSLALHHVPTIEAKSAIFGRVFHALPRGGVFVNADVNMPADESERDALYRDWAGHLVASGITADRAWQHFEEWSDEDTYLPLDGELAALASHGFEAASGWRDGPIGVVVARKA